MNILGIWKANICEPFAKTVGAAAGASRVLDERVALGGWAELFRVQRGIVSREYRARLIFIWAHVPAFKMSNVYTVVWHHLPVICLKGRGCDRKWQAEEGWIRAVALLRLWGCDKGVSNVSLLARQQGVLGGSEGAKKQYASYSNYGSLINDRNDG